MARQAGRLIALAAVMLACGAAAADSPVAALAGRYSWHFQNGLVDGESYWSDDVVEIVPVDRTHAYVRFALNFYNGHSCSLAGVAEAQRQSLIYREPGDAGYEERCTLTIARRGGTLVWDDRGSCKSRCGARGSFLNGSMAWSSKRPIRYLPRLKASSEYRSALTEWRTGHAVRN